MQPPDYTIQQLRANNASIIPGDMIFSTLTWFGVAGAAVTFTATPPPGAPPFMAPPNILLGSGGEPPQKPGSPSHPRPPAAPRAPPVAVFSPPLFPSTLLSSSGGGGSGGRVAWQIGLVLGLVVGVVVLLGLLLTLLWRQQRCCWGRRKDGGTYKIKVQGYAEWGGRRP